VGLSGHTMGYAFWGPWSGMTSHAASMLPPTISDRRALGGTGAAGARISPNLCLAMSLATRPAAGGGNLGGQ
jgi:hypothetical protein